MAGAKTAKRPLATGSRAKRARRRSAHVMKPEYLAEIERIDKGSEEGRYAMCEAFERIRDRVIAPANSACRIASSTVHNTRGVDGVCVECAITAQNSDISWGGGIL